MRIPENFLGFIKWCCGRYLTDDIAAQNYRYLTDVAAQNYIKEDSGLSLSLFLSLSIYLFLSLYLSLSNDFPWQDHAPKSEFCILIPGDGIPEWFEHREMGSSLTMELPSDWYDRDNFLGFCVCFVFAFKDQLPQIHDEILCQLNNFSFFYPYWDKWSGEHSSNDPHMWLAYQPRSAVDICHPEAWSSIRASFELSGVTDALSIKCGIQLIYRRRH